jgi:phosphopantetheinyl transferase
MMNILLAEVSASGLVPPPVSVSAERAARIRRLHSPLDRARSHTADRLLSQLVTARGGTKHCYLASGRPAALTGGIQLSASHDGRWAAAAAGSNCVGLDLVEVRRFNGVTPTVYLNAAELAYLHRNIPARAAGVFMATCWAAKEAYTKRVGVGLYLNPKNLSVELLSAKNIRVTSQAGRSRAMVTIHTVDSAHLLAVSGSSGDLADMSIRTVSRSMKDGQHER